MARGKPFSKAGMLVSDPNMQSNWHRTASFDLPKLKSMIAKHQNLLDDNLLLELGIKYRFSTGYKKYCPQCYKRHKSFESMRNCIIKFHEAQKQIPEV